MFIGTKYKKPRLTKEQKADPTVAKNFRPDKNAPAQEYKPKYPVGYHTHSTKHIPSFVENDKKVEK